MTFRVDTIDAHDAHIWSIQVSPDRKTLVTGSADKAVKFWNIDVVMEDVPGTEVKSFSSFVDF